MTVAKEIRIKIHSLKNTKKITKAMEVVAASKMRKTQARMAASIPYAEKMMQIISHVALGHAEYRHPYIFGREIRRAGYIIITTDRGLCGGLNNNLLKAAIKHMQTHIEGGVGIDLGVIGNKGLSFFKRVGGNIVAFKNKLGDSPTIADLIGIIKIMLDAYLSGQIDVLYLFSNKFINALRQEPSIQQVLPLVPGDDPNLKHHWDYIYEPDEAPRLLDKLLKRYIEAQIYRAAVENVACEQAARMLAMRNATDNAADLIDNLQLIYNKSRQAAITKELTEIVAGASVI